MACGVCAAAWIVISLEGLPLVALLAALYGVRYWLARDRSLAWFLAALTAATAALSLATRPWSEFGGSHCDIILPGHIAAFAVATAVAAMLPLAPGQIGQAPGWPRLRRFRSSAFRSLSPPLAHVPFTRWERSIRWWRSTGTTR